MLGALERIHHMSVASRSHTSGRIYSMVMVVRWIPQDEESFWSSIVRVIALGPGMLTAEAAGSVVEAFAEQL